MGTGKTVSTLTALDRLYLFGEIERPTLVLAPLRVAASVWPEEIMKWNHLSRFEAAIVTGSADERKRALRKDANLFMMNYDNLPWLMDTLGSRWPFDCVIADESTRLKGFRTKQGAKRLRQLAKQARFTKRWINLTGSPAPNGLVDTWGQNWFLDYGQRLLPSFNQFSNRWFYKSFDGHSLIPHVFAGEQISKAIQDITLTIDIRDYYDISEPIVYPVYVDLPKKVTLLYKEMQRDLCIELENEEVTAFSAAAKSQKLLQLASGAVYVDDGEGKYAIVHDEKIEALKSIVEETNGAPLLVAYHFRSDRERLLKAFPQAVLLDKKPSTIKQWNEGKIRMLLAHPASCGHGLNLQDGGNILVYFSHDWSLENREQILERIGPTRQFQAGHDRPVFVYNIIARGTIDRDVIARTETKASVQDTLKKAMKRG